MPLSAGTTLGNYRILALLGQGGMGEVYRAHDERLRRDVAVKLLSGAGISQQERRARILNEARAAAALNHPGITTIFEVAEDGEHAFIVMELVGGSSLRAYLQAHVRTDVRSACSIACQVAEALASAHAQGVVHGDVKPENVALPADGHVKLLDFGIAKMQCEDTLTLTTQLPQSDRGLCGTLAYMAPELLRGGAASAQSDLFALGVMLYEMVAGRRPFPGPTTSVLVEQITHEPPLPLPRDVAVPAALQHILDRLLEKSPAQRYASARDVYLDLNNVQRDLDLRIAGPEVTGKPAVAVLPFVLLMPASGDEYLSVAMADAVIHRLGVSRDLLVRPASTVQKYAGQTADPLTVARELNVRYVVEGSVQKMGQQLRVHVQAIDALDGAVLCSSKHDGDVSGVFLLQDQISEALAQSLGAQVPSDDKKKEAPPTRNAAAYELYLRAADRLVHLNKWDTATAIGMLRDAVKIDPDFSLAWARLAEACVLMASTLDPDPAWLRDAERAIRKALVLDPGSADAHCARGRLLWTPAKRFQNVAALRALNTALRINPACHQAQVWKCLIFMHIGLLPEAEQGLSACLATHPDDPFVLAFICQTAFYRNDYERAAEFGQRALRLDPGHLWANVFYPSVALYQGRLDEAEKRIQHAYKVIPSDAWVMSCEGLLWAKRGEVRKASNVLQRSLRARKTFLHTHHLWHNAAAAYALMEKDDAAVTWLNRAAGFGLPNHTAFQTDPHFRSLAGNKKFDTLMGKLARSHAEFQRDYGADRHAASA